MPQYMSRILPPVLGSVLWCQAAAESVSDDCLRHVRLRPGESTTIAVAVQNDYAMYASMVVAATGRVKTEDGVNRLQSVWIKHSDLFRWGKNKDVANNVGPIFSIKERLGFVLKGGADLRVKAANTTTHLCLCTAFDASEVDAGYQARRYACEKSLSRHP